jgi:hypothetical protein
MSIYLNGLKVELSAQTLKAHVQAMLNNQEVEPLRQALGDEWFLHWRQGKLYGIPRVITPQKPFGQPEELNCNEHEHLQHLQGTIGDRIAAINTNEYQSVITASPIEYCFDAARTKRSPYPWVGIDKYGPFSRETFSKKTPEVIVFFPDTVQGAVENFLRALRDGISIKKKEIDEYGYLEWKETSRYAGGFAKIFGIVNPKFTLQSVPWFNNTQKPPANVYRDAIERTLASREVMPDAAIVVILDNQARLPESANPYLNSKALLLMAGIPAQSIRLSAVWVQASESKPHMPELASDCKHH